MSVLLGNLIQSNLIKKCVTRPLTLCSKALPCSLVKCDVTYCSTVECNVVYCGEV